MSENQGEWLDKPTVSGFYWIYRGKGFRLIVAEYRSTEYGECFYLPGSYQEFRIDYYTKAKWFGPLDPPALAKANQPEIAYDAVSGAICPPAGLESGGDLSPATSQGELSPTK